MGRFYQQKVFLQISNYSAFSKIQLLIEDLKTAKWSTNKAIEQIWFMYNYIKHIQQPIQNYHYLNDHKNFILKNKKFDTNCLNEIKLILNYLELELIDLKISMHLNFSKTIHLVSLTNLSDQKISNYKDNYEEFQLIDGFFNAKAIVSPSAFVLRKILKLVRN